jgi:chromosome segregation ATPase
MTDLRLFMSQRKKEIQEEFDPLAERRRSLRAQLDEVTTRMLRLKTELDEIEKAEQAIAGHEPEPKVELTIKQAVMKVLEQERRPMTALQILAAINERYFDGKVARSSLSPQLSRLANNDNKIKYDGRMWSLRSENEEGPEESEPSF